MRVGRPTLLSSFLPPSESLQRSCLSEKGSYRGMEIERKKERGGGERAAEKIGTRGEPRMERDHGTGLTVYSTPVQCEFTSRNCTKQIILILRVRRTIYLSRHHGHEAILLVFLLTHA